MKWRPADYLWLRRGPYVIAAGLDESPVRFGKTVTGKYVNLFDAQLSILSQVTLSPGSRYFLLDLGRLDLTQPRVIASASKIQEVKAGEHRLDFYSSGPRQTTAMTRVFLPAPPASVRVQTMSGTLEATTSWDEATHTAGFQFPNAPLGAVVTVTY